MVFMHVKRPSSERGILRARRGMSLLGSGAITLALALASIEGPSYAQENFKVTAQSRIDAKAYNDALTILSDAHEKGLADAESYRLLALTYLNMGSGIPAEAAIDRARQLGADYAATAVAHSKALLIQGKFARALEGMRGVTIPESQQDDALIITGDAYFATGDFASARRNYEQARSRFPDDYQAYLGLARLDLKEGKLDEAKVFADQAYDRAKDNTMVQYTRGLLARYAGDIALAETYMLDAVELYSGNMMANIELAGIRINQGRYEEAEKFLDTVYASSPKNPMALFLSGTILASRGQYAEADALLTRARDVTENYLPALYVRGLVAYQLDKLDDAVRYLTTVLRARPANRPARLALAGTYLKLQQPTNAYNTLQPLISQQQEDVDVLAMAAAILMASGEVERGKAMYERVAAIQERTGRQVVGGLGTKVALAQFVAGDTEAALATLSQVTAGRESQIRELGVLGSMQLRTNDYDGAMTTIAKILASAPDRALGYNMRGTLEFQQRRFDAAYDWFTQALSRQENYYTALRNRGLAALNLGRYAQAERDLKQLLEQQPNDVRAKAALGKVLLENKKAEEAVPYFREAVRSMSGAVELWADYSQALADSGNTTRAIEEARATAVRGEDRPDILKRMGLLLLDLQQPAAAERPLSRYAAFHFNSGEAQLLHGRALLSSGLYTGARMSFRRAAQATEEPVDKEILNWYLFATEALGNKLEDAEVRLPQLVFSKRPKDVAANLIGNVFLDKGEPELAAAAYRDAIRVKRDSGLTIGLSRALFALGQSAEGVAELEKYAQKNPQDRLVRLELAQRYEQAERYMDASAQYENLLQSGVADAGVVAKLAIVYLRLGNRASSQLAERAYLMAPDDPSILDVAGWVALQAERKTSKAVELLEKAVRRAPGNANYKYHLGIAYVARGDRRDAARVLEQALSLDPNFEGAADARRQLLDLQL